MKRFGWRGALGLAVSAGLLVWTLRDVPFDHIWVVLRGSSLGLFVLSAACATAIFPVRAWRWRYILEPVAPRVPLGMLWRAVAVGMMINNTVPARAGEIARAFALSRESGDVPFPAAVASLVIDRVFDAIVLIVLLAVAMMVPSFPGASTIQGQPISRFAVIAAAAAVGLLVALILVSFAPHRAFALYDRTLGRIAPALAARARPLLESFANGLRSLQSPRLFALITVWTLVHWLLNAFAFWIGFKAVGIEVPFGAALFVQSLIAMGVAAPSTPGFFGVFEFFAKEGLLIYGVPPDLCVSWALGYHVLSFIPITAIGAWYFARMGLHLGDLSTAKDTAPASARR